MFHLILVLPAIVNDQAIITTTHYILGSYDGLVSQELKWVFQAIDSSMHSGLVLWLLELLLMCASRQCWGSLLSETAGVVMMQRGDRRLTVE